MRDTEVAKQIRKELKGTFPKQKFSVRTESGLDASINVSWKDGVPTAKVEPIVDKFKDIDRDAQGGIQKGGNRYVFTKREISPEKREKVKKKIAKKYGKTQKDVEYDNYLNSKVHQKLREMHL